MKEHRHKEESATILEIQRMSTEDGPGLRTTVFFKGCSLKCRWCHNPESISARPQLHWIGNRCIGCKICLDVCPEGALVFTPAGNTVDRSKCNGCGICAQECPSTALELLGQSWGLEDLCAEVVKDKTYFEKSNGGVTLGGGEPLLQSDFCKRLLVRLKENAIHTAVDTCGLVSRKALDWIIPYADLLLYDLKEINPRQHELFTGCDNHIILQNLIYIKECMQSDGKPGELWIRTPVIPGATAAEENVRGIGQFMAEHLDGFVSRWDLCAFNNLCRDKYLRLDLAWEYKDSGLLNKLFMEKMAAVARNSGVNPDIVHWSGSTRLDGNDMSKSQAVSN
jgi:pyruvate formate lyase activating enzyme